MPPARRQLRALGSLQLNGYANNPTKVITELAFIADARVNVVPEDDTESDADVSLDVSFDEFMNGVNTRGRGTKTRQRKMTVEQAAAVLLVMVQRGDVELMPKADDPHVIAVIRILPRAKRKLATFLPKLRGYGDIPYEQQYRGAIALAKRHFFPRGQAPTKKELMALLLESYQHQRELRSRCQHRKALLTQTLGVQTSLASLQALSHTETPNDESARCAPLAADPNMVETTSKSNSESTVVSADNDVVVDVEPTSVASDIDPEFEDNHDMVPERESQPLQLVLATPVAPRSFNPYMTPISNPRVGQTEAAPSSLFNTPTPGASSDNDVTLNGDSLTIGEIGELLQGTATTLNHWYERFDISMGMVVFWRKEYEDLQRRFDNLRRRLDGTEQRLREANADRMRLGRRVNNLMRKVTTLAGQLLGLTVNEPFEKEDFSAKDN